MTSIVTIERKTLQGIAAALIFLFAISVIGAYAQGIEENWSEPITLSTPAGDASEAYMVADPYGGLNVFWTESIFDTGQTLIYYSRFDGESWTDAIDIYASWPDTPIDSMAAAMDAEDNLHLTWTEGLTGPVFHSRAALNEAESARNWTDPRNIGLPAKMLEMEIDEDGVAHIVYMVADGEFPGIYYSQSHVAGRLWSYPQRIDEDRPSMAIPEFVDLAMDDDGGLHAVWSYIDTSIESQYGRWVRYSHKLAGSPEWSEPQSMDVVDFLEEFLRSPRPRVAVIEENVHVVWGGTHNREPGVASINRFHRISEDLGRSWGEPEPILGSLVGQAGGDGVAIDGAGRLHFASQLRWPQAIHHATWEGGSWAEPQVTYLIREDAQEDFGPRVHAHFVRIGVIQGNQLVLIFRTARESPQGVLYAMTREMEDVEHIEPQEMDGQGAAPNDPTPTRTASPQPADEATASPPPTALPLDGLDDTPRSPVNGSASLWIGVVPVVLLLAGVLVYRKFTHHV